MEETKVEVTANGQEVATVDGVPPVSADTVARCIVFALAWVNQLFAFFGMPILEFDENATYLGISCIITLVVSTYTTWKDNAFTAAARVSNAIMRAFKREAKVPKHAKED